MLVPKKGLISAQIEMKMCVYFDCTVGAVTRQPSVAQRIASSIPAWSNSNLLIRTGYIQYQPDRPGPRPAPYNIWLMDW
uniref:SFRICE_009265 n=1 Tax=Spodoptera frugiperda TaxID=7108 RepID=A0A2H1WLE0_SPOFR